MRTSYHVHTNRSDGVDAFDDYIRAALDANIDELGFSDHYALPPSGETPDWSMAPDSIPDYMRCIGEAAERVGGKLTVRRGLEVDFFPTQISAISDAVDGHPFDYLIGSVHFIGEFVVDSTPAPWLDLSQTGINDMCSAYWDLIRQLAESRLFDIVGHIDVLRKFGFVSSIDMTPHVRTALDAVKQAGMVVEVNTSGWYTPSGQAYPEPWILRECLTRGIPTLVTADAHEAKNVTRDFERAESLRAEMGFSGTVRFDTRRRYQCD